MDRDREGWRVEVMSLTAVVGDKVEVGQREWERERERGWNMIR